MEQAEVDHANSPSAIASAAHTDKESSIENARQEAIERVSLAAWWSLDRPFITKLSGEDIDDMLHKSRIEKPEGFSIHIGFVEPIHPDYYVACSILSNSKIYPFTVLGGGCSKNATLAAERALYESFQSWTATDWIDSHHDTQDKVYWDIGELTNRITGLSNITMGYPEKEPSSQTYHIDDLEARVTTHNDVYITEIVEPRTTSSTTLELARLAMKDGERITVFTPHNI